MHIILASASPRRSELLGMLGVDFEIRAPHIDETVLQGETPEDFCSRVSRKKAYDIADSFPQALVIAADTAVVLGERIMGKPADTSEAAGFLRSLRNRPHDVFTGYTVMIREEKRSVTKVIRTRVYFNDMTEEEINWYVSSGEPMDKAGAYAIQGLGQLFVNKIEGSHSNVIGLPLSDLYQDLKTFNIKMRYRRENE